MKKIPHRFIWLTLIIAAVAALFLFFFPWEKTAKVTYQEAPRIATIDSIIQPVSPGMLSVMSPTQHNGYGYRTVNTKTGAIGAFYCDAPVHCLTADICPGGKWLAGTFQYREGGKIFGITRIDLQRQQVASMPQPWNSVQQPAWSPDGRFISFIIIDSTVSKVSQLGVWDIEKNSASLCTKIDAAVFSPKWRPGTQCIGCIAKTNSGDGILSYNTETRAWDTLLAPTQKLSTMNIVFSFNNAQMIFAGNWDGEKGLYSLNTKSGSVKQLFKGQCREPTVSWNGDTTACIAQVDSKDWLVQIEVRSGSMKKITPADSVYWPQWVWPASNK